MAVYILQWLDYSQQVVWLGKPVLDSTWEPLSALPSNLVADFERGVQHDICTHSSTSGGQTVHTISIAHTNETDVTIPEPKRVRTNVESGTSG